MLNLTSTPAYRKFSKTIRAEANCSGKSYPIVDVDGFDAPAVAGESWHYETKGGRRIHHPSAYSKNGWSNMVYIGSTKRIEVGRGWLIEQGLDAWEDAAKEHLALKALKAAA